MWPSHVMLPHLVDQVSSAKAWNTEFVEGVYRFGQIFQPMSLKVTLRHIDTSIDICDVVTHVACAIPICGGSIPVKAEWSNVGIMFSAF